MCIVNTKPGMLKGWSFLAEISFFPQSTRTAVKTTVFLSSPTAVTLAETSNSLLCWSFGTLWVLKDNLWKAFGATWPSCVEFVINEKKVRIAATVVMDWPFNNGRTSKSCAISQKYNVLIIALSRIFLQTPKLVNF